MNITEMNDDMMSMSEMRKEVMMTVLSYVAAVMAFLISWNFLSFILDEIYYMTYCY